MSFYDDIGVPHTATAAEIREQYRVLVRLFHPDRFSDPSLKAAAEGQMRRFNEMEAVLTDAERRRAYDNSLFRDRSKPAILIQALPPERPVQRFPWGSVAWGAAAMVCAGAIVWVSDRETLPVRVAPVVTPVRVEFADGKLAATSTNEDWRGRARTAIAERDQALREVARLRAEVGRVQASPEVPDVSRASVPAMAAAAALPAPPQLASAETRQVANRFAGIWFYASRPGKDSKLYAPEFIEAQISETDGHMMRGRFRSRYRVTDRAISPSVNFEFSGQAEGSSAQMPFVREGGGRGEVRLRLISERELELAWTAADTGSISLVSGKAVLVRAQ